MLAYFDKLGRKLREASKGFDGSWANIDYQYNALGHNTKVSEPYYTGDTVYWNTFTYNGLTVTSRVDIYGKNQQKIEERDVLGNLVKVTDNAGKDIVYSYDPYGLMTSTTPPSVAGLTVSATTITYDALGRKTSMSDPDKGTWYYTYNGLGELITQKNARNEVTCMAYDKVGRMTKRVDYYGGTVSNDVGVASQSTSSCSSPGGSSQTSNWVYDTASGKGKGKLHQVTGPNSYSKTFTYDGTYGHNTSVSETIAGSTYVTDMTYDSKSRLDKLKYPGPSNRLEIRHLYNSRGFLSTIENASSGADYYLVTEMDARGNVTEEKHGNGSGILTTKRFYDVKTGFVENIQTGTINPFDNVQDLTVDFDKVGNLTDRADYVKDFYETFDYDNLNRLEATYADFGNSQTQTVNITYDALGNIKTKTGVGTYEYGSQCGAGNRMHAVCEITGGSIGTKNTTYAYDANGNMTSGDGRSITWSAFDKPLSISQGTNSSTMSYNPDRNLITRSDVTGAGTTTTVYVGGYEKVSLPGGNVEERHNVGGSALVTFTNRTSGSAGTTKTRYLHKDHLGSVTVITDENGNEVEAFSFDPWGKRRAPSLSQLQAILGSWSGLTTYEKGNLTINPLTLTSTNTDRGFTGHRQLDSVGLVHMGGRVYDAEIGRFLSADPFVQAASAQPLQLCPE